MQRRDFIILIGGSLSWPLTAHAQQSEMPVIGFLNGGSADGYARATNRFHQALQETGYIVGQNVAIEYRWAQGQYERLPALADDLVGRRVAVLIVNSAAALAAKAATATIPIVFANGGDPVKQGLVASLNQPGGNLTGVYFLIDALATKNLDLLHELVPKATVIGMLLNPTDPNAQGQSRSLQVAAPKLGLQPHVLEASTESDFERAFATLVKWRAEALIVTADSFFFSRLQQLVTLATRYSVPTVYPWR
jgi:putative tryptophan/tyrosine transport system substrate-binding protein